ncbi:hypothetical protein M569_00558, partial [Genlisea aurea]
VSKQIRPLPQLPTMANLLLRQNPPENKVVVVMGATGTGKSRLSIDLAEYFGGEVINSDKMQVFRGLDITTNKITDEERSCVPHHLLGISDPLSEFSAGNFRTLATAAVGSILSRGNLPLIVGGSNSYVEALIDSNFRSKFECCFLWVDVALPELHVSLSERVDRMVHKGMIEEVKEFYRPDGDYSYGILKSIGVPELDRFFRVESLCDDQETRRKILTEAIDAVKINTSKLAFRQLEKIRRLKTVNGWRLHRLDATEALKKPAGESDAAWDRNVSAPAFSVVSRFL